MSVLLDLATTARDGNELIRAEKLTRRVLDLSPDNLRALGILCSILRDQNRPGQAVEETAPYLDQYYLTLITSHAAALCDLGRWDEAKQVIQRALTMSYQVEAVIERIKKARPDLYPGE